MIRFPKPGQRVQLWYRKSATRTMPHHASFGTVVAFGIGRGPRNVAVQLEAGGVVVVPRGNLRVYGESDDMRF